MAFDDLLDAFFDAVDEVDRARRTFQRNPIDALTEAARERAEAGERIGEGRGAVPRDDPGFRFLEELVDLIGFDVDKSTEEIANDPELVRQVQEEARRSPEITENRLEQLRRAARDVPMVDYETYMSVALNKCGSDERTFSRLAKTWSNNKAEIKTMTQAELRRELTCP